MSHDLPPIRTGEARAFRQCSCGRVGWYDYLPYSLSVPILAFPCGHDPQAARYITEDEFHAAIAIPQPFHVTRDDINRLLCETNGRTLHVCFGRDEVTLHPDCKWPIPLLAEWRAGAPA
jgi:hypothetical protein